VASLESYQDYQDLCEEFLSYCGKAKKNKEAFLKSGRVLQDNANRLEEDCWKISNYDLDQMTSKVKTMIAVVKRVIELENRE
jgi:hypothetical protein